MSEILNTLKNFKHYETLAFCTFLFNAFLLSFDSQWFAFITSLCAAIWVFISSSWRQTCSNLISIVGGGEDE